MYAGGWLGRGADIGHSFTAGVFECSRREDTVPGC